MNRHYTWFLKPGAVLLTIQVLVLAWLGYLVLNQFLHGRLLAEATHDQSRENKTLDYRNQRLLSQVEALRRGDLSVVEERARKDLGMIKDDEKFFIFVD